MGSYPDVTYEGAKYTLDKVEEGVKKQNALISAFSAQISSYQSKVTEYNQKADEIYDQLKIWNTYTWLDRWFTSEETIVTYKLPSQPSEPKAPAPSTSPELKNIVFSNGGSGSPLSGEISLAAAFAGKSKYFGVLGQTDTAGDYGFTVEGDTSPTKCKARYVALSMHVHTDAGVKATDEIKIEVSVQSTFKAKELTFNTMPSVPAVSFRTDPYSKFKTESEATGAKFLIASVMTLVATSLAYF